MLAGQGLSFLGSMVTYVALPYQTYRLTGSSLMVGLLSFAELVPLLGAALFGGALADYRDAAAWCRSPSSRARRAQACCS